MRSKKIKLEIITFPFLRKKFPLTIFPMDYLDFADMISK